MRLEKAQYTEKWFAATGRPERDRQAFLRETENVPDIRTNPLMLSLLCALYRARGYIPRNRRTVYEACADLLFQRWDAMRHIEQPVDHRHYGTRLMQELALFFYKSQSAQASVQEGQLRKLIATFFTDTASVDEVDARSRAQDFLDFCADRAWLLSHQGTDSGDHRMFGFTHRTFMEYFAAEALVRRVRTLGEVVNEMVLAYDRDASSVLVDVIFQWADDKYDGGARDAVPRRAGSGRRTPTTPSDVPRRRPTRAVSSVHVYDNLDRIKTVSSTNDTVRYWYDGDGNLVQRSDGTGTVKYDFDPLQRETVRHLQDGSQTLLAYTAAGNVDFYQDPAGKTDYTWNDVNKLTELKDPQGAVTTYAYNNNDVRTSTTYPGGTLQKIDVDKSGRPTAIKVTSGQGTLVDLAYTYGYGTGSATDGDKIRTSTDDVSGRKRTYTYDGAGRFSYAADVRDGATADSWQYCYDLAGNLTSQGTDQGCPRTTTYTYDDAQQLTGKSSTGGTWSYDAIGNETAGASTADYTRTGETWTDYLQMSSITVNSKTYTAQYGSTDQSERVRLGDTYFHNGPLGLSAKSTGGVDMGFNREPGGTLNSMTTGGRIYYYLTDAIGSVVGLADADGNKVDTYTYSPRGVRLLAQSSESVAQPYRFAGNYQDPTGLYHLKARYYDANIGRFTQPDPSGQEQNPYLYAEGDPVNRIDPNGLLSFGDVTGVGDWASLAYATLTGDTGSANATKMGMLAGIGVESLCLAGAAAGAFPTLGLLVGAGFTGCSVVAAGAAGATTAAYS